MRLWIRDIYLSLWIFSFTSTIKNTSLFFLLLNRIWKNVIWIVNFLKTFLLWIIIWFNICRGWLWNYFCLLSYKLYMILFGFLLLIHNIYYLIFITILTFMDLRVWLLILNFIIYAIANFYTLKNLFVLIL